MPTTPETPVVLGSLSWGVKESFRSYITGPIAKGGISVLAPATADGSRYVFPQSSSALARTTGSASYAGAVHFTGHAGALELTLSNPTVRVTGPTSGVLVVDAKGKKISGEVLDLQAVDFATLTLPTPTTAGGATTWTDAQATLTAAGATAFSDFYPAGAAIDPVTFTVGSDVGSTPGGQNPGTGPGTDPGAPVVVTPLAPGTYANAIASVTTVVPGGEVTFTGQGFGSGTENIEAAVYSERQLLASGITADASGAATATVTLPKNLAPGVHTLSLESPSGVRSQVQITVEAPVVPTAAQQCVARSVSGATLSWGVKESFRTYITGPIAKGSITPSGVTSSGSSFGWGGGSGKFNTEVNQGRVAFPGSVNFSGHGGILDLTISNVRVQVSSASTGSLVADVSSTDMNGTASEQKGVTIASLGLAGKKSTTGSTVSWSGVSATLTSAGASAFGGFYVAGDAMDPVSFSFPLGSEVDCDASSGANGAGSLATTGADGSVSAALAALLALTVGVGAVGLARRRRTVG
ncbi:HtaA domain-containing protein [Sanguibacter sp. Leaf3]|uniref:HtaA domain-containing protein n=1 Tax=Sanguibacter sp. Leaf3 TaxID=1736209 RepID=UPI0019102015